MGPERTYAVPCKAAGTFPHPIWHPPGTFPYTFPYQGSAATCGFRAGEPGLRVRFTSKG